VHAETWRALSAQQRSQLETACTATTLRTMARNESVQGPALSQLQERGIVLRSFPDSVVMALKKASDEVHAALASRDLAFKRILHSQQAFRRANTDWRRLGYQ